MRPWLWRTHPNFALIFTATVVFHVWCAANYAVYGPAAYETPPFAYVNDVAAPRWWAFAHVVTAVLMVIGLFQAPRKQFLIARIGLAFGLAQTASRVVLLILARVNLGVSIGDGGAVFFLAAALHMAQTLEPPENPSAL